jgi:hypothetical protein
MRGYCNLCNQLRELTRDHVPPQGSVNLRRAELRPLLDRMEPEANTPQTAFFANMPPGRPRRILQNGPHYRSICGDCNNRLLGSRYDPEIKRISEEAGRCVKATSKGLILPDQLKVSVRTHFLMRGIIGHLLAAREPEEPPAPSPQNQSGFYESLRKYFLDESLPLPSDVTFFYWTYPSRDAVVVRSLVIGSRVTGQTIMGDLLKFFPVAYFMANTRVDSLKLHTPNIVGHGCNDMDCKVELFIDLKRINRLEWPEFVRSREFFTFMPMHRSLLPRSMAYDSRRKASRKLKPRRVSR